MSNDFERLGRNLGDLLRGLLGSSSERLPQERKPQGGNGEPDWGSTGIGPQPGQWNEQFPPDFRLWGDINNAPKLIPGHLLVVHLATSTCYQVDPESGDCTLLFTLRWGPRTFMWRAIADSDGLIYCSVSGTLASTTGAIPPGYAPPAAKFRYWGAIVRIDHRRGTITPLVETKIPSTGDVLDPHGMQMIGEDRLLVADFQGFEPGGAIYTVNKQSGLLQVISKDGLFKVPVSALQDADGTIWVANADMTEQNDGEIIRVSPDGRQSAFLPWSGKNTGQVVGLLQSYKADELVVFRCEWPNLRGNSAVFTINKKSKKIEYLLRSSVDEPRFYNTNGDVSGTMLWFGESVRKEIIGYDLKAKAVVKTIDFRGVAGGWRGMADSYDGIESVTVIPIQGRDTTK